MLLAGLLVSVVLVLASCSARLDRDTGADEAAKDAPSLQLKSWSEMHYEPYGIPERALRSYAYAAAAMSRANPECGLGWSTLAAIGAVSSDHGRANSAHTDDAGLVTPRLRGLRQASAGGRVADTDAGRYDGSDQADFAMGPMQILPSKWEQWAISADDGGTPDPDNLDDAALTTARFLCAAGGTLTQSAGWATAVGQFNARKGFLEDVHKQAVVYGR